MPLTPSTLYLGLIAALLAWAGFGGPTAHAQEAPPRYVQEHWTVAEGLPSNRLTVVRQASDGYIWVGSDQGLVRFDGVRFTVFTPENSPGLPNGDIHRLYEASDSTVWMQTADRQAVHLKHGVFTAYGAEQGFLKGSTFLQQVEGEVWINLVRYADGRMEPIQGLPENVYLLSIYQEENGTFWFGTQEQGLIRFQDGRHTTFSTDQGLAGTRVEEIRGDTREPGVIWFLAGKQLHRYHDGRVTRIPLAPRIGYVFQEPSGRWWLAGVDGLYRSEGSDPARITPVDPVGEYFSDFRWQPHVDAQGHVWVTSPRHLFRDGAVVFSHPRISHFTVDTSGSAWITTKDDGLYRLKPAPFQVYSVPEGLTHKVVFPLLEDRQGSLWLGTQQGGLNKLDQGRVTVAGVPGVPSPAVYALHEDRAGTLWVGTQAGVCRLEGERCRREPALSFQHTTRAILEDRQGVLWFGTEEGLYRYAHGQVATYTTNDGLSSDWIQGILEARDGALWLATNGGGIIRYRDEQFTPFTTTEGLSSNTVRALYEDDAGYLWVGTEGGGLNRIEVPPDPDDLATAMVTVYREEDGLFDSNVIHLILEDEQGRLWISSNLGLFWIWKQALDDLAAGRRERVHSVVYAEQDGLRSPAGNGRIQPAGIKTRDGRLWFATEDGAAVVDPGGLAQYAKPPSVVIEDMTVWGQPRAIQHGAAALAATERQFSFAYTALSWPDGDRARFAYQLEGYDEDWVEAGGKREAIYGGVGPGRYRFRVRAMNHQGVWSEEASLALMIAPFYYETVWFWLLSGLGVLLLLGGVYRWRIRRLLARERVLETLVTERTAEVARQAEQLRALDEAKSHFFANISHEFRTPLTLAMGPLEDARAGRHGPLSDGLRGSIDQALLNNRRLLRLVNQLLDVAKLEADEITLHARPINVGAFLDAIAQAFVPLAERKHIAFTRTLPDEPTRLYADPDQLEKVVSNLLANAFKFTPEHGRIALTLHADEGTVVIAVRDTGPGIPAEHLPKIFDRFASVNLRVDQGDTGAVQWQAGTGIGLALAKELVTLHGGRIAVESIEGFGTTFTVTLPVGTAHGEEAGPVVEVEPDVQGASWALSVDPAETGSSTDQAEPALEAPEDEDRLTILIVEDNAEVRVFVKGHLGETYRIVEAADGAEGLALARAITPDLILSDVMMPRLDGYGLCRALKHDPALHFIPIILLTARAAAEDKLAGLEEGADDYLTKPFSTEELKVRIRNLIAQRQRLRDHFRASAPALSLPPLDVQASDTLFIDRVRAVVEAHLSDEAFTVEAMAEAVGVDRTHLYRRMQALLGRSPSAYLWQLRLERAAQLLLRQAGTVSEIAYGVGFKSVPHFTRRFRAHFDCSPTEYVAAQRSGDAAS